MSFISATELAARPDLMEPPAVLVPPIGIEGRVVLLTLGPKAGKSTTAAGLLAAGSRLGIRCGLLTLDEALADSLQRIQRFTPAPDGIYLSDRWDPATLGEEVAQLGLQLLILDHLGKLAEMSPEFGAGSQGDPLLWGRLVSPFTTLAREQNLAVVLLDQARKSDGAYAGSTAKAGSVDLLCEMQLKDGGLACSPKGRVFLPPFRVDLDPEGVPRFSGGAAATPDDRGGPDGHEREILQLLSDSEPEGLTSTAWLKMSGLPKMTFNRRRKALLRTGLALSPEHTRGGRYRITEKGETSLSVPSVPLGTTGTTGTMGRVGTIGTKPLKGLVRGTSHEADHDSDGLVPMVPTAGLAEAGST